jgi:hypothetical protein
VLASAVAACGLTAGLVLGSATAAVAQDYPRPQPPATVLGGSQQRGGQVASEAGTQSVGGGSLAVTGGDLAAMAAVGVGAVGAGAVLVRRGRRRLG